MSSFYEHCRSSGSGLENEVFESLPPREVLGIWTISSLPNKSNRVENPYDSKRDCHASNELLRAIKIRIHESPGQLSAEILHAALRAVLAAVIKVHVSAFVGTRTPAGLAVAVAHISNAVSIGVEVEWRGIGADVEFQ